MRFSRIAAFAVLLYSAEAFAQNSRAIITGIISDPEGAAIRNAAVEAENPDTKAKYQAATTSTGNYAFSNLPNGRYVISISAVGFKPYASKEVVTSTAHITRFDIVLESINPPKKTETKEEEEGEEGEEPEENKAPPEPGLPKLESSQWVHNIKGEAFDDLPLLGFPAIVGRIRNPLYVLQVTPGSLMTNFQYFRINGAPSSTQSIRIEGQDVNNGIMPSRTVQNQVGVDAVEEFSIQTSSYAAEYGQAGGGIVNMAMRSGTNAYHGSVYNYLANEEFNARQPYTSDKPQDRRYDYGATFGGPLVIPKNYDGHNKTYIFFNFEQFRQMDVYEKVFTVPTLAFRQGDFRKVLTGRSLGTDSQGRTIMEGMIYDPASESVINGIRVRNSFSNNIIAKSRFDSIAKKIQTLIPTPTDTNNSHVTDNYVIPWESPSLDSIGSFRADQNFAQSKVSFYFGINKETASQSPDQGGDGFTSPVTSGNKTDITAQTYQLNFEHTMSPTRVLHVGLGYQGMNWQQNPGYGTYNQSSGLGLKGAILDYFPYISGLRAALGGMKDMGMDMQGVSKMVKPSANASVTWVRGNHIYKFGGELRLEGYPTAMEYPAYGFLNFSADQTGLPSTFAQDLKGGTIGFPYASFLLGLVNNGDIGVVSHPRLGKHSLALFAQDSWKLSPKTTLEYGLRYDYQTYLKETYGRMASFSPTALNPSAGNLPGAMIYEGSGTGHCNCDFAKVYPYAFGPRIGLAYQLKPRIILRVGGGVLYGQTATDNGATLSSGSTNPFYPTAYDKEGRKLSSGFPSANPWPNLNSEQQLVGNGVSPTAVFPKAGRPPRQIQWSMGIQTQIKGNLLLDIAYVGNRGIWWESNGLANANALTTDRLSSFGLDITKSADRLLLTSAMNSSLASQRGFSKLPYSGFPLTQTVAQSLRPFPQYGDILYRWAPLGKTWYDAVQVKVTRQYSHGLAFNAGFSYQKEYALGNEDDGNITSLESINNAFDLPANKHVSALSRHYTGYVIPSYTFPRYAKNHLLSMILGDWKFTAALQYGSGLPIHVPMSNSNLYSLIFQTTYANRLKGASLYNKKLNDRTINPMSDFVLNAGAWTDPGDGAFSTSTAYYNDYRFKRRPSEQMSFGRSFRVTDKIHLNVRADFQNVFNRHDMADPYFINAGATQVRRDYNPADKVENDTVPISGFGYVDYRIKASNPRNGQIVIRMQF